MDAVFIGETCDKLKQQGMPEHLAVIHAITYTLTGRHFYSVFENETVSNISNFCYGIIIENNFK